MASSSSYSTKIPATSYYPFPGSWHPILRPPFFTTTLLPWLAPAMPGWTVVKLLLINPMKFFFLPEHNPICLATLRDPPRSDVELNFLCLKLSSDHTSSRGASDPWPFSGTERSQPFDGDHEVVAGVSDIPFQEVWLVNIDLEIFLHCMLLGEGKASPSVFGKHILGTCHDNQWL